MIINMKLYDPISKDSIIHKIDRDCGSTANTQSIRDKIARVNSALDRYLHLAFGADGRWNFDDINESSPPIDTQNIVSGTNRYKFSDFTEKILQLFRLTVLNSDGIECELKPETFDDLPDTFLQTYKSTNTGTPDHYIKYGDFIYIRPYPDYSETDGLRAYFNRPASKFEFATYTQTIANPSVFTSTAHGLAVNDTVMLETDGALPTNFAVDTIYYVKTVPTANTFTLATTLGGTAIEGAGSQSGIHYFIETSRVPGVPEIHHPWLADYASWDFLDGKPDLSAKADRVFRRVQIGEKAIMDFFARRSKDERNILKPRITQFR